MGKANHESANLTVEQVANCRKLIAYLRTLPVDYPDFEMSDFVAADGDRDGRQAFAHVAECGTAACAAGHGPKAGVSPIEGETWYAYSRRAFCDDIGCEDIGITPWDWCFSANWTDVDNSAHGAADRMEYMLDNGIPDNAGNVQYGGDPLPYRVAAS